MAEPVRIEPPRGGERVRIRDGRAEAPDHAIVPFIRGDGTGPDVWRATELVLDAAVARAYHGRRKIHWMEIPAGEAAFERHGSHFPRESLETIRHHALAIKGPLTTPVGSGFRSLNVTLRQELDLYACVRPVRHFPGVPSPVRFPERVNVVIFRENMEDVYAGVEWRAGSDEARRLAAFLRDELGAKLPGGEAPAIGVKPMSEAGAKRLVRRALRHAIEHGLPTVTLVHKGNIMKFTEGAFRDWGYEVARDEFGDRTVLENVVKSEHGGKAPPGRVVVNDRIADSMFQQILLRPEEYSVIATPNLNGDYLSDAVAAQVGGLGMAPGANLGDEGAVFEATHGSAPRYAGLDKVNPGSLILSGAMMLDWLGWREAARLVEAAIEKTIALGIVTYDLARLMEGAREVKCSEFARAVVEGMEGD